MLYDLAGVARDRHTSYYRILDRNEACSPLYSLESSAATSLESPFTPFVHWHNRVFATSWGRVQPKSRRV